MTGHESNRREFLTGRASGSESEGTDQPASAPAQAPQAGDTVRLETRAMACVWNVIFNPGPPDQVMAATEAFSVVHALEEQLSIYRSESEISKLNRSLLFGEWFPIEQGFLKLLQRCQQIHAETEGAFDPLTRPLLSLWRTCRREGRLPTETEIEVALSWGGMQHVRLSEREGVVCTLQGLETPPLEIGFDLGAIGKGYAIDRAADCLNNLQLEDYLIHGGYSSVLARGTHAGQSGWPVGIKNPLFTNRRYATVVLRDQALSSSGSNVQFYRHEGQRYGHLLDPRTGWPAETLLSVTVLAPDAALADALSTAFYVMGLDNSLKYCDDHPEIGVLLIPFPHRGRTLAPVIRNIPDEVLFFEP